MGGPGSSELEKPPPDGAAEAGPGGAADAAGPASRLSVAFREAVVATLVALLMTLLVYSTNLRETGSDLSQKALVAVRASPLAFVPARILPDPPAAWVLLDVELGRCAETAERCAPTSGLKGASLAALVDKVRQSGPRLVVVDILTAGGESLERGVDPKLAAILDKPGPPVLLAWGARASWRDPARRLMYLDEHDRALFPPPFRYGRYLPASIAGRPVARPLLPSLCLQESGGPARIVPTLAYGAALIAAGRGSGLAAVDPHLRRSAANAAARSPTASDCGTLGGSPQAAAFARTERVFSAGSLAPATGEADYWTAAGRWLHYKMASDATARLPSADVLADSVVLVGSADRDTGDLHWTALDEISGGEIVLNDIRQFVLTEPAPAKPAWHKLGTKWPFFLAGLVAAFIAAYLVPHATGRRARGLRPFLSGIGRSAGNLALALALGAIFFGLILWTMPRHLGSPPDFVTPFIALSAEALFEILYQVTSGCRNLLGLDSHGDSR